MRRRIAFAGGLLPAATKLALAIALLLFATSNSPAAGTVTVIVTGKTVFSGMGVEEAQITAYGGNLAVTGKSGYHGTFILHLPPGTFDIKAKLTLPGEGEVGGEIKALVIPTTVSRVDQVVIELTHTKTLQKN